MPESYIKIKETAILHVLKLSFDERWNNNEDKVYIYISDTYCILHSSCKRKYLLLIVVVFIANDVVYISAQLFSLVINCLVVKRDYKGRIS